MQAVNAVIGSGLGSSAWHWGMEDCCNNLNSGNTLTSPYGEAVAAYIATGATGAPTPGAPVGGTGNIGGAGTGTGSGSCTTPSPTPAPTPTPSPSPTPAPSPTPSPSPAPSPAPSPTPSPSSSPAACGTSSGKTFSTAPTTNLCSSGTATAVTNTGVSYSWSCTSSAGTNAACFALLGSSTTPPSGGTTPTPNPNAQPGTWQSGDLPFPGLPSGMAFHYDYLLPDGYSSANKYPIIVYEHEDCEGDGWYYGGGDPLTLVDSGMMEFDSFNTQYYRSHYPSIVVVPYADQQSGCNDTVYNFGGYGDQPGSDPNEQAVVALVLNFEQNYSVDTTRVYATGDSLGGIGSWALGVDYNNTNGIVGKVFTAVMPFAGVIERGGLTQSYINQLQAGGVPVFVVSGAGDGTSRVQDWNEPMWQALAGNSNYPPAPGAEAGNSSYWYLEDPALGHDVWDTYRDFSTSAPLPMYNWLFSQVH